MVDRLSQKLGKFLIVKNLEAAAAGNLTDSGGVEAMVEVAISTLNKDAAVTKTLGIHLPTNVVQMNTWKRSDQREAEQSTAESQTSVEEPQHLERHNKCQQPPLDGLQ